MTPPESTGKRLNILWTVDVEDYYMSPESIPVSSWNKDIFEERIKIGCKKLLELFSQYQIRATWFFLGWIAEKNRELVREVHAQGHEIATHSYDHRPVNQLSIREFEESLERSIQILESIIQEKVVGIRAPMWSFKRSDEEIFMLLKDKGFLYDSSLNPMVTYLYGEKKLPRFPYRLQKDSSLWEIPPSAIRLGWKTLTVGGGAFLRIFPLVYMRWAIRKYNREGYPAVVYIHPWELDPDHPKLNLPFKENLIHNWGLRSTERKLCSLLADSYSQRMRDYITGLSSSD